MVSKAQDHVNKLTSLDNDKKNILTCKVNGSYVGEVDDKGNMFFMNNRLPPKQALAFAAWINDTFGDPNA
jgi:hypothetical protein